MPRKPPALPVDVPPDPEDIRDTLLRATALRANALLSMAQQCTPEGVVGYTKATRTQPARAIVFPVYELQAYLQAVTTVTASDLRELREMGKMSPAALEAAVNARRRLEEAKRGKADA